MVFGTWAGSTSALAQPQMAFGGQNKRVGHAAMETFLVLNGWELAAGVDEQEQVILRLAAGTLQREEFTVWVQSHLQQRPSELGATADGGR